MHSTNLLFYACYSLKASSPSPTSNWLSIQSVNSMTNRWTHFSKRRRKKPYRHNNRKKMERRGSRALDVLSPSINLHLWQLQHFLLCVLTIEQNSGLLPIHYNLQMSSAYPLNTDIPKNMYCWPLRMHDVFLQTIFWILIRKITYTKNYSYNFIRFLVNVC